MNQEQYRGMMILAETSDDGMVQELDPLRIPEDILSGLHAKGFIRLFAIDGCFITDKGFHAIAEHRAHVQHGIEKKARERKLTIQSFWESILTAAGGAALALLIEHFGNIVNWAMKLM